MGTPHVAGLVALMLQEYLSLMPDRIEEILEESTLPIPAGSVSVDGDLVTWGDDATGSGLVQADRVLAHMP